MTNCSINDTDITILGSGIAGLSMADALLQRGKTVAVVDTGVPGDGSSGAPLVLINPATGRRAKLVKNAEACIESAEDLLKRTARHSGESNFFSNNGVLRPALTEKLATDFKRSPEKYAWPNSNWIHWLDKNEFNTRYPYVGEHYGGLIIPNAYTVDANRYIKLLSDFLRSEGLYTHFNSDYNIEKADNTFRIQLESKRSFSTEKIVYAIGSGIKHIPEWSFLPASYIKGQLLDLIFKDPLPLENSISSMGYFAFNPDQLNRLVTGSTYEHQYNHLQPDENGKKYLYEKLERTLPDFKNREHSVSMWAGERVSMSDHNPVVGSHPQLKDRFILGGLGSKGMIYGRYLAGQLTNYILDEKPIDPEFNVERFFKH